MLTNYTFNHGYCNGSDLSLSHNTSDMVECGRDCFNQDGCAAFLIDPAGICYLKSSGCDSLKHVANRKWQAFNKGICFNTLSTYS